LTKKLHVARAGKALAGWPDCRMKVSAPSLAVILSTDNRRKVETYAVELFSKGPAAMQPGRHLQAFRDVMLASLLMYFHEMEKTHGHCNSVVKTMVQKANVVDITIKTLRDWGEIIYKDWKLRNSANEKCSGTELERAQLAIEKLVAEAADQNKRNQVLEDKLTKLQANQDLMLRMLESLVVQRAHSPPRKSPRKEDTQSRTETVVGFTEESCTSLATTTTTTRESNVSNVPNAVELMMLGASRAGSGPYFPNLLKMRASHFLSDVVLQKVNVNHKDCFGYDITKQTKARGKLLYDSLMKKCTEEERIFFRSTRPEPSHPTYTEWKAKLTSTCERIETQLLSDIKSDQEPLKAKNPKLCEPKLTVGSMSNQIELLKTARENGEIK